MGQAVCYDPDSDSDSDAEFRLCLTRISHQISEGHGSAQPAVIGAVPSPCLHPKRHLVWTSAANFASATIFVYDAQDVGVPGDLSRVLLLLKAEKGRNVTVEGASC